MSVTLNRAAAERKSSPDRFEYSLYGTIENNSDEGILQVVYTFAFFDENGEEFRSFGEVFDGEDTALAPHTQTSFSVEGVKWGAQSVPASVELGISSVKTEAELPPAYLPQPGDYLYQIAGDERLANMKEEPPVELAFHVDQGGCGRTATFAGDETLEQAVSLFCDIRIGAESDEWVTDNYNWIRLTWEDGTYSYISLNLMNFEYSVHSSTHTYSLENLDAFWFYAEAYLEAD